MGRRLLRNTALTFQRFAVDGYVSASGKIEAPSEALSFRATGSLQPVSQRDREAIPGKGGFLVRSAYRFYTGTPGIVSLDRGVDRADETEIDGQVYTVWANAYWRGVTQQTTHYVLTLVRKDEIAL